MSFLKEQFLKQNFTLDEKSKRLLPKLIRVAIIVFAVLYFFNGLTRHVIPEGELEKTFVTKVAEMGLGEGQVPPPVVHGNSITFLFTNDAGEKACATYAKSLYSRYWKEERFYTSKMGLFATGRIEYDINDKLTSFDVVCDFTSTVPTVSFGEEEKPVLPVKVFGVSVTICAGAAGWMIGMVQIRKRNNRGK